MVGTSGQDAIDGSVAADNLRGEGGADSIHGRAGADLIDGGDGDDYLSGDLGNDTINGGAGRDYLEGGQGNDILNGGDGDDQVYDYGGSDRLSGGVGNDRMGVSYSYTLSGLASTIDGDAGADDIAVTIYGDDHVDVNAGSDNDVVTTEVETGSATVTLGDGADTLRLQQSLSYRQQTGIVTVTDFATGAGGDIVDVAPIYNSYFVKNRIGDDPFASGHMRLVQYGSDTMLQFDHDGPGQDTPYANLVRFQNVDANELTAAHFGGFTPRVVSAADAATATIMVAGTAVEGNTASLPLQLILRDVTRVVTSVTVFFAADLSTADSSDAAVPAFDRNFYLTDLPGGDHAIMLPSISLFDDLRAEGTETITIRVRATAEIFENGTDTMDVTIALQDNDFIGGAGADALSGTAYAEFFDGGAGDDTLSGMGGDDRLDGGAGADLLIGGTGDDSYFADADDTIIERAGEGNDTIYVRSSYALAAGLSIESVRTTGSSTTYAADLTGNEIANTLVGNAVANRLDGRAGADVMWGYGGDDIYFVDNAGDKVSELAGGGKDTVYTTTSYSLAAGSAVEELRTLGSATTYAADLTGNELANTIVGNAASNRLDGRAGADVMWGYAGDDFYYVDNVGDVVMERAGEGFDTIYAKADFALTRGSSIELLCTFGSSTGYAVNLSGNELANTIYGNAAGNTINGGGDADVMAGFGGNDSYYVDNAGDVVIEAAGGGTDTVYTATSYTLADNSAVEELRTFGSSTSYAADLTGNGLGNTIVGNAAANTIHGGGGNDSIWSYGGNDQLFGDAGDDSFVFGPGFGRDVIADFAGNGAAAGDTIRFLPGTIGSFGALMNKAAQQGDDVVFTLDENTSLTLAGTRLAAINAQDFVFG
ncbi:hypothetical protein SCH01S_51_00670 [Sphingomonas changbaiensis NBRC 104936]|uniref:Calcium-binding protein n=1 Tax=Sphingomonas changbaiensis NBRC 104936 TaxID=1219043 RepID=A0A0E9MUB7_9SPHN|nr:calcium-binding protein [Sphingomonas changbaiensis]GAO40735.1 hypothetical protein SCH01S_51_00670 [Sphingomonas changbaiensis NBRC 104936]